MPFFALANWNWGGRLHPLYYDLSIATKQLLGLAIMNCRIIVLRHSEHDDDQEKGFVGNTILLQQPRPQHIRQMLPPSDEEMPDYISVCFNTQKMTTADLAKTKAFVLSPAQYIACGELRQKIHPLYADVSIDTEQVWRQWPEQAVPTSILQSAQDMDTLHTFNPTLDGPATMKVPTCNLPSNEQEPDVVDDDAADTQHDHCEDNTHSIEKDVDASGLPLDLPAEYLIGVQEEDNHTLLTRLGPPLNSNLPYCNH